MGQPRCSSESKILKANSFLLSLCSPVLQNMVLEKVSNKKEKRLDLLDVDGTTFGKALDLWCGREFDHEVDLQEVRQLASVANRFQMTDVVAAIEETIIPQLCVGVCGEVLSWSGDTGLKQLEEAAMRLAAERFEEFVRTESFLSIDEKVLGSLLDDDGLSARSEELVWESVVLWMKAKEGKLRGRELLHKIRFPLMCEEYLRSKAVPMLPPEHADWVEGLVEEGLRVKAARSENASIETKFLGPMALVRRAMPGVTWKKYVDGGERRLEGLKEDVYTVAECEGQICTGSADGSIRILSRATLHHVRTLRDGGRDCVGALVVWGGRLISGHHSGKLRVWNVLSGACESVLEGHARGVWALAVCMSRLVSGSTDGSIKVWAKEGPDAYACERTLVGHTSWVQTLAAWQDKVISGSSDGSIRVWDVEAGANDAKLVGHENWVNGLAVDGDRLLSASSDGTIREWALGSWEALRTVEAHGRGEEQFPRCLVVSGSKLISGSCAPDSAKGVQREVRVWDLKTLALRHTLRQPAGADVNALVTVEEEVWAVVGGTLVVWGRR